MAHAGPAHRAGPRAHSTTRRTTLAAVHDVQLLGYSKTRRPLPTPDRGSRRRRSSPATPRREARRSSTCETSSPAVRPAQAGGRRLPVARRDHGAATLAALARPDRTARHRRHAPLVAYIRCLAVRRARAAGLPGGLTITGLDTSRCSGLIESGRTDLVKACSTTSPHI